MKNSLSIKELKEICQKKKEGLIEHYVYREISIIFTRLLIKTNITANQVTMFSLFLGLVAAILFLFGEYKYLIIGAILYNFAYVFDLVDGEIVRYRNYISKLDKEVYTALGQWLDAMTDILKISFVFVGLTLGAYLLTKNVNSLIAGFIAINNIFIVYIFMIRKRIKTREHREFKFSKRFFIGSGEIVTVLVTIAALLNQIYYLLLFFAVVGVFVWLKQFYSGYKLFKEKKLDFPG